MELFPLAILYEVQFPFTRLDYTKLYHCIRLLSPQVNLSPLAILYEVLVPFLAGESLDRAVARADADMAARGEARGCYCSIHDYTTTRLHCQTATQLRSYT